jgi:hypothetical protein
MHGRFDVWIGLVEVKPLPGNDLLDGDPGAFANTLTVAGDAEDFCTRAANFFRGEGFEVLGFEHVERLDDRVRDGAVPDEMLLLGEEARTTSNVRFDTYFRYRSADD